MESRCRAGRGGGGAEESSTSNASGRDSLRRWGKSVASQPPPRRCVAAVAERPSCWRWGGSLALVRALAFVALRSHPLRKRPNSSTFCSSRPRYGLFFFSSLYCHVSNTILFWGCKFEFSFSLVGTSQTPLVRSSRSPRSRNRFFFIFVWSRSPGLLLFAFLSLCDSQWQDVTFLSLR